MSQSITAPSRRRACVRLLVAPALGCTVACTSVAAAAPVEEVIVTGLAERRIPLDAASGTGSRLGLTLRETPATLEVLTQAYLLERGVRTSVEALNSAPGVMAANAASSPGIASMRGFTGNAVSLLHDGVRQTSSGFTTRNLDSWGFERIEVLKGPASVLYGEGALAGAVNLVPKRPHRRAHESAVLASYGSYDAVRLAADVNVPLGERSAARWVASYSESDGFLDDNRFEMRASAVSWSWLPHDALTIDLSADYYDDDSRQSYWGTPLVPREVARRPDDSVRGPGDLVLDRALAGANFNLEDAVTDARAVWLRSVARWRISEVWQLTGEVSHYEADRRWRNSENYRYEAASGLLSRGTTRIDHDQRFDSARLALSSDARLAGARNRFSFGLEYDRNDFFTPRRFGRASPIDPYAAGRGRFPERDDAASFPGAGNRTDLDSLITGAAVFLEDAYNLSPQWLLTGALRYERMKLERVVRDLNAATRTAFEREYEPLSWRLGSVYELAQSTQLFAQYSSAFAPVGSLLLLSPANARFSLTHGESLEAGIKTSPWGERLVLTAAAFRITQDDIVTRDPLNSSITLQGGRQSSRGVELSLSAAVTRKLRLDAGLGALDARFDSLIDAGGADRHGRTPPNVPRTVIDLGAVYQLDTLPVTLSLNARRTGHFYTDNANSVRVDDSTLLDAAISCRLRRTEVTLRGRNLLDELYAGWGGASATQVLIGAPRSIDLTFTARFH